ncbi:SLC13 family permease [Aureibacter tunicatorum]|uniref:Sodium-dependent dicarboxylate transporter 2/3/5 n=1 Tax=Aureibacter tunicatorum TaxID=866807 RepID=A0AAE3XSB2_9BACT|nr:DASS family sodium-coupled anion symporter [Aureibacter tunicatorum]MDR6241702.1 sodium-dependent dicarboxylate transporter 2/3/5 [Aureibacter tunicatorum]BDD07313.1 sodium:sulfate symporter [Aureibacter tunicatorum]
MANFLWNFFKPRSNKDALESKAMLDLLRGQDSFVLNRQFWLFIVSSVIASVVTYLMLQAGVVQQASLMTGIFVLAGLLWATEALPLFATALLVIALEVVLLANPIGLDGLGFANGDSPSYRKFFAPISNPIIILFLGGFVLAQASVKEGVDKALAGFILKVFGGKPAMVLLGMMSITAIFSMWMSNTATTAMMMTLTVPMLAQLPKGEPIRKGIVLSIPFAANIGGLGTPIASPPNAVAVGVLSEIGQDVGFLDWMKVGVPLAAVLLFIAWGLLWVFYKPSSKDIELKVGKEKIVGRAWFVIGVFSVTILLWLTEKIHGIPTAVVALIPVVMFTATNVLTRKDINSLEWNILLLIAGGIALGEGMSMTGLDKIIIGKIPLQPETSVAVLTVATLLFSTFMSNTAASNLILPIGIALATSMVGANTPTPKVIGISIALVASMAMSLPVSTPPNVIAYSSGEIETKDFLKLGSIIGFIGLIIVLLFGETLIEIFIGK